MRHAFRFPLACVLACAAFAAASQEPAPPLPAPATATMDFEQARFAAGQDEARLDGDQVADLAKAQGDFMKPNVARCTRGVPTRELTPVGLVMELDAKGRVVRTWQDTHTAVANCLAEALKAQVFFVPPKAPFLTAMDMSWTH
jgi:hypothetical protein